MLFPSLCERFLTPMFTYGCSLSPARAHFPQKPYLYSLMKEQGWVVGYESFPEETETLRSQGSCLPVPHWC
jgi:hypothetical protein